ncbi:HAMP domain-containing sensor histidine kinase [Rugosimonospora acidiphila]|uniref:Signal transduction histidine-protein kinase/phosphatase MprB n=1 Tax=Rugosimonospora acidiphila TaxID=556531 RepID=A0ABP9SRU6_9ACTN
MSGRWWIGGRAWGLRVRLLLAFASLGAITTAVVAGASYVQARTVILQQAQDAAVLSLTTKITDLFAAEGLPATQQELNDIAGTMSGRDDSTLLVYRGQTSTASSLTVDTLPAQLRHAVAGGRVAWQRVVSDGHPGVLIGTQLLVERPNGGAVPSGLEIYSAHDLDAEQHSLDQLAARDWATGGFSLVLALLLGLLAARGVLRPVRELGRAAHRLGEGDLTTRLSVSGSDELAAVARTFNDTAEALEGYVGELRRMEADARRFVADVSHELRTPLAAMAAVADVLDEEAPHLPGDAGKAARLVSQETHSLTRLVNDLIEISRFDSGTAALALDEVDVASAVIASLRARGWADRVATELPSGVTARLDPRRLDIILANLVGNALRHGAEPVRVRLRAEPDWLVIEVSDHGPGLRPEVLPHVFDRFYKADTARTRSEGSGLGLAIAWENAQLHRRAGERGSLVAANRPEGGASFTLRLPRRAADPADPRGPADPMDPAAGPMDPRGATDPGGQR